MPKKPVDPALKERKPDYKNKFADYKNSRWVLNNLDENQLAKMDATDFDMSRGLEWFEKLVDEGMEIKFTFDRYSECYQANLFGAWEGWKNTGYGVSARSNTFEDIVKILWFKYEFLCEGDLPSAWEDKPRTSRRG